MKPHKNAKQYIADGQEIAGSVRSIWHRLGVVFIAGLLIAGCDNSLQPLNTEKGIYSIYGFIDVNADVNYIRIKDMNIPLVDDTTQTIDAAVTLTDLNTGASQVLQDSVVQFANVSTHNFRTTMDIQPETTYRIRVEGSDGRSVSATTTTPGIAQYNAEPTGEQCDTPITIRFEPVDEETLIILRLTFMLGGQQFGAQQLLQAPVTGEYNGILTHRFSPLQLIRDSVNDSDLHCWSMDTEYIEARYIHFGPDYEFGGESNVSDSLTVPGGAGQFVGLLRNSFSIRIDTTEISAHLN